MLQLDRNRTDPARSASTGARETGDDAPAGGAWFERNDHYRGRYTEQHNHRHRAPPGPHEPPAHVASLPLHAATTARERIAPSPARACS